jgi:hypothetical protein
VRRRPTLLRFRVIIPLVMLAALAGLADCSRKGAQERAGRERPGTGVEGAGAEGTARPLTIGYGWVQSGDRILLDARHLGELHRGEPLIIVAAGPIVRSASWERPVARDDDISGFTPVGEGAAPGIALPLETLPPDMAHAYVIVLIARESAAAGTRGPGAGSGPTIYPPARITPPEIARLLPRLFPGVAPERLKGSLIDLGGLLYGTWARREGEGDPVTVTLVEVTSDADGNARLTRAEGPYGPRAPKCADVEPPTWEDCCEPYLPQLLVAADLDGDGVTEVVQYDQCLEAVTFWVERPARGLERFDEASAYTLTSGAGAPAAPDKPDLHSLGSGSLKYR